MAPPQYQQFTVLADVLAALELHVSGESLTPSLVLEGIGKSETAKIDHLLDRAIEFAGAAVDRRAAQLAAEDPGPVSEATGKYLKRMLNTAIAALGRHQSGNRLTVAVKADSSLTPSMAASGVAVALLLPAVQSARDAARLAQATNNLKQIGLALQIYADVHKTFPPRAIFKNGKPLLSWRVAVLPFIEQELHDAGVAFADGVVQRRERSRVNLARQRRRLAQQFSHRCFIAAGAGGNHTRRRRVRIGHGWEAFTSGQSFAQASASTRRRAWGLSACLRPFLPVLFAVEQAAGYARSSLAFLEDDRHAAEPYSFDHVGGIARRGAVY